MNTRSCELTTTASALAFAALALVSQAAPAPVVLKDVSIYGFPDFLTSLNSTTKGWMFAPPFVGLKWVELNGVLLVGNTGVNDPETGLAFTGAPTNHVVSGLDWLEASQRPARNGISRGGLVGDALPFGLKLAATPGHTYLLEILTLGSKTKRAFNVMVNGQPVVKDWTVLADKAANRLLRLQVEAAANGIDLQFTLGTRADADPTPALSALALTDLAGGVSQHDPIFGRVATGLVNIAALGTGSSPDGMKQDGDGRGSQAALDGDPSTYWDEQDNAKLYRYVVSFKQPEKISALAIMGWAQHDFAPKDFEVLCDGKAVKKVENAQYDRNILHLPLDDTTCQSIELKITGYYGRSPAIRELGIFSREPHVGIPKPTSAAAKSEPKDGGPIFAEWPVTYQQQKLLVYALGKFKPYVKELAPFKGRNIFRDAPFDHLHHHALMYAVKANGVNFWEEVAGCGFQKPIETSNWTEGKSANGQPQFTLKQRLHWLAPQDADLSDTTQVAILVERRTLTLTVNEAQQEVALHWKSEFEVGPKTNQVTLTGANYHGLGMRFLQPLDPFAKHLNSGGAPDLSGNKQDVSQHPWASVSFGQSATLVLFGHPANARGDSWFFTMRTPFAYLSATQNLDKEPLVYRAGEKFQVNYLVTLYPGPKSPEAINQRGQQWAGSKP
ncbi:MAG: PmoA family protein [Verrucomicrobia bacterium]|nr:PmoA family protein [Verrucomicrobiota bacterium]